MHQMLTVERQDTRQYSARLAHLQVNVVPKRATATIEFRLPTAPAVGAVIAAVVVLLCTVAASAAAPPRLLSASSDAQEWTTFKTRFLQPDGRVPDTHNGGVSQPDTHGFGMPFVAPFAPRDTFARICSWAVAR